MELNEQLLWHLAELIITLNSLMSSNFYFTYAAQMPLPISLYSYPYSQILFG